MKKSDTKDTGPVEPTKSELEILQVLWEYGESTVRFVHDKLNEQKREVNYTTTLKQMQVMLEKKLLIRNDSQMKHTYTAAAEESKTKNMLLNRFIETMYKGSASSLMIQLLGNKKTSKKEIEAMKKLLKDMDQSK
ncbi:MAG TPA: BlaI/MecI/CopY family transcriptional regulator [Flavitalea sp.]|nr:BlaI/MecI/CopY family transcriptional regulator [Flavitalea sp.]